MKSQPSAFSRLANSALWLTSQPPSTQSLAEMRRPSTPSNAQFRQRIDYASLWTIGLKGTF